MKVTTVLIISGLLAAPSAYSSKKTEAKKVIAEEMKTLGEEQAGQRKVDKLSEETQALLGKYRRTLKRIENTRLYNKQLREVIASQKQEKVSIAEQIATLKETNQGIVPLMVAMVDNIEKFVALDVPFLPKERSKRLAELQLLLGRADVSTSEKFRRILEAYQVENDYGRTIEAYRGVQKIGDKELTVDFLRIGRVALIYQSLDGEITALWNREKKAWEKLGGYYEKSVQAGLKMARKQSAPQLIKLPIFAPGDVQ